MCAWIEATRGSVAGVPASEPTKANSVLKFGVVEMARRLFCQAARASRSAGVFRYDGSDDAFSVEFQVSSGRNRSSIWTSMLA